MTAAPSAMAGTPAREPPNLPTAVRLIRMLNGQNTCHDTMWEWGSSLCLIFYLCPFSLLFRVPLTTQTMRLASLMVWVAHANEWQKMKENGRAHW